jgi:hypothetical protein
MRPAYAESWDFEVMFPNGKACSGRLVFTFILRHVMRQRESLLGPMVILTKGPSTLK